MITNDITEEIKSILDDVVNPITIEKAVKPEVSKESLLEVIKELQEIIIGMVEVEEEDPEMENETMDSESSGPISKAEHMTDTMGCKCNGCMECKASGGCNMEISKSSRVNGRLTAMGLDRSARVQEPATSAMDEADGERAYLQ